MKIVKCSTVLGFALSAAVFGLVLFGLSNAKSSGQGRNVIELDEASVFVEINATDGDAGFQFFWDADAWTKMELRDPSGQRILSTKARGSLGRQGVTEGFFESEEPSFDEQPLDDFLARFPEGIYTFRGMTTDKSWVEGEAELTHHLPAGPKIISPLEEQIVDPDIDLIVQWEGVTEDIRGGPLGSQIVRYVVVIEFEDEESVPEVEEVLTMDVPPDEFSTRIPEEFLKPGREYKVELIAREESGNQTATEVPFFTADSE